MNGTDWKDAASAAEGFEAYDDLPERVIGYPAVFTALGLGEPHVRVLLDYGCGPGKVASRAVKQFPQLTVQAVDISARMLELARDRRSHDRITYHLLNGPALPFLADNSVDAAMSCYVFITIGEIGTIQAIADEVYRVLRPGGRYVVLDTNPATTGIQFSTFRHGDPDREYQAGESRRGLLSLPRGGQLELLDHHWPRQSYLDVLRAAGFDSVTTHEPLLGSTDDIFAARPGSAVADGPYRSEAPAEASRPPFLVVTGAKHG